VINPFQGYYDKMQFIKKAVSVYHRVRQNLRKEPSTELGSGYEMRNDTEAKT